ncbi:MAG: PepSY domain-containing protein, partial [Opitutales bacterium]|nr:PepSY domain-containing protein [Opitutales bacterium]
MSLQLPRKRTILAWHRWMGFASALFLLVLSVTGLLLNHTERLGLDDITIRNSMILDRYGMAAGNEITAYRIHESNTIAHLDGQLFY